MANTVRIKRRAAGGAAGAPASLQNAELAFNEQDLTLYYGLGTGGAGGSATSVIPIAGAGAFVGLTGAQSVDGVKTFLQTIQGSISGNAGTVTNGVYTNGSYANPAWLTSLAWSKITGTPTTIAGYGLTDAVNKTGDTMTGVLTTAAGTASVAGGIKLTSGTLKTTPVVGDAGGVEFDGTSVYVINSAAARKTFAFLDSNVASATKLQTARTINGVSFDGTGNITITANTTNALTAGSYLTGGTFNGSSAVTFAVDATSANTASKVVARDASGNFSAGTITAALSGNATTASTLATARSISTTGDATWTVSFNGGADVSAALTLANSGVTAGTYTKITVDAKGRATVGTTLSATDIPTLTASKISDFDTQVRTSRLDQMAAPTADVSLNSRKITNLLDPVNAQDAATKNYVDMTVQGLDPKQSVRAASTANIASLSGTMTIDGVALLAGDRVLVKDQTTQSQNGIYLVAAGAWTRSLDADSWAELPGAYVFAESGTVNADMGYVCTVDAGGTLGTTAITFQQFSGAGQISAGLGLTKTGNSIDIGTASSARIVVNADNIDLATIGTAGTYRSVTVDAYGRVSAGTNPTTLAGYGITDAQGLDATLTALASLTTAADQMIYATGVDAFSMTSLTAFGRSLIDDADAATARTTLGLGSMAVQNSTSVSITGGSITNLSTFDGITIDCGTY
jgi:phage-related tail fiber protein